MTRPPRIDFPGAKHHVMNRGARKENIFRTDDDRAHFLGILEKLIQQFELVVHGFVLMPNHFHIMLESSRGNLSRALGHLQSLYSRHFNRSYEWDGPLFRGRFNSRLVMRQDHWTYLLAYLHLNPVRARLVNHIDQYIWSSHYAYAGKIVHQSWLHKGDLLEAFGSENGYREFIGEVIEGRRQAPDEFGRALFEKAAIVPSTADDPHSRKKAIDQALSEIEQVTGSRLRDLKKIRRGRRGNPARVIAVYWLVHRAGLSSSRTARLLGMTPQAASQALQRARHRAHSNLTLSTYKSNLLKLVG